MNPEFERMIVIFRHDPTIKLRDLKMNHHFTSGMLARFYILAKRKALNHDN